jgi:hypothetical protein
MGLQWRGKYLFRDGGRAVEPVQALSLFRRLRAGEGEFGIVHKALFHGTLVAAKILKGSSAIALGDFRSEIEVLRKVWLVFWCVFPRAPHPACGAQLPASPVATLARSHGFYLIRMTHIVVCEIIQILPQVHHPNAVQFLGACTKQEPYILVTGALHPLPPA